MKLGLDKNRPIGESRAFLNAGDYSLQLQATNSSDTWENVEIYYFRVAQ